MKSFWLSDFIWRQTFQSILVRVGNGLSLIRHQAITWSSTDFTADTLRNNDVVITPKPRHFDVFTSKWPCFDAITTLLLRRVFRGLLTIGPLETHLNEIVLKSKHFHWNQIHLKWWSARCQTLCSSLKVSIFFTFSAVGSCQGIPQWLHHVLNLVNPVSHTTYARYQLSGHDFHDAVDTTHPMQGFWQHGLAELIDPVKRKTQRIRDATITSSLRQNVATSFWRNDDVIIAPRVHWRDIRHCQCEKTTSSVTLKPKGCRLPDACPTNDIPIPGEIRPKFAVLWFKIYCTDHNKILHTSR